MASDSLPKKKQHDQTKNNPDKDSKPTRRDFLRLTATSVGVVGVGAAIWPFIDSMNPAKDTVAASTTEVDLSQIPEGASKTVMWQGKPVFVMHRSKNDIMSMKDISLKKLIDPQTDSERFPINPQWLVVIGICTHLGCIPTERKSVKMADNGWLCACHGSAYDLSGRVTKGPAPRNLDVPPHVIKDKTLIIG